MTSDNWVYGAALLLYWLGYFIVHSLLASLPVKRWVVAHKPGFMPAYRLMLNVIAVVLLVPIVWLTVLQAWPVLWQWQGIASWIAHVLKGLALLGFIWSLKYCDLQEFFGFKQWRMHQLIAEDQENFRLSSLHRFVRHPWYFFALVLLWTQDMNVGKLITSGMATLYFAIGSRMEEKKLLVYHGERYRRYMERVPGLFPLPWKFLRRDEEQGL